MNRRMRFLLLLLILLATGALCGQNAKTDSLINLLKTHQTDDSSKVNLLNKIANGYNKDPGKMKDYATRSNELAEKIHYLKGDAASLWLIGMSCTKNDKGLAIEYMQKAVKMAGEVNDKAGMARYLNWLGVTYKAHEENARAIESYQKAIGLYTELKARPELARVFINLSSLYRSEGKYLLSIDGYQKAYKLYEELKDDSEVANCLNSLGIIYAYQGNYPLALENFQKYLKNKEEKRDKPNIFSGLTNIGGIYLAQLDYPKALEIYQKALKIAEELNHKAKIATSFGNIGTTYQKTNNLEAITFFQKALTICEEIKDKPLTINILVFIGDFYKQQGELEKAMFNYTKAQKMAEETGNRRQTSEAMSQIGAIYLKQKKFPAALNYTLKSLALADELMALDFQKEEHKQLSEIYTASGDFRNALLHNQQFHALNDSIFSEKNIKKITELEFSYEFEKEKQATELQHQKDEALHAARSRQQAIVIFALIVSFLLMLFLAIFLFRSSRFKNKTNLILTQQKHDIEELNEEYHAINEELLQSNEQLHIAKNQVEERENLLIQITDNIPVFISLLDTDLNYVFANSRYAEIFSKRKTEIYGKNPKEILAHENFELAYPNLVKALEGKTVTFENPTLRKDGSHSLLQTTYLPYYQKNNIEGVLVCSDDITERRLAELALMEIEAEKAKLMELEIDRIGRELESNQKSVTAATLKLIQNSERDARTIERLQDIEKNADAEGRQKINSLISDYKRLSYNSNWDEFEILFEKVHNSFYEKLNTQFPTLTANDRKICAFLKLNMSSKEIAQITFQSDEALKKARLRLRQKLEIDRETNLVTFLQNI